MNSNGTNKKASKTKKSTGSASKKSQSTLNSPSKRTTGTSPSTKRTATKKTATPSSAPQNMEPLSSESQSPTNTRSGGSSVPDVFESIKQRSKANKAAGGNGRVKPTQSESKALLKSLQEGVKKMSQGGRPSLPESEKKRSFSVAAKEHEIQELKELATKLGCSLGECVMLLLKARPQDDYLEYILKKRIHKKA